MTAPIFTKTQRRAFRAIAGQAYEAELGSELDDLFKEFQRWRKGEIFASELADAIHEFHNGPNRDIWVYYNRARDSAWLAARGIAEGFVAQEKIAPEVFNALQPLVELYKNNSEPPERSEPDDDDE